MVRIQPSLRIVQHTRLGNHEHVTAGLSTARVREKTHTRTLNVEKQYAHVTGIAFMTYGWPRKELWWIVFRQLVCVTISIAHAQVQPRACSPQAYPVTTVRDPHVSISGVLSTQLPLFVGTRPTLVLTTHDAGALPLTIENKGNHGCPDLPIYHWLILWTVSRSFDSLFRVLFNFPSRYLFTIGSVEIFSLRSSLRPALRCMLKQRDSLGIEAEPTHLPRAHTGLAPSAESKPFLRITVNIQNDLGTRLCRA